MYPDEALIERFVEIALTAMRRVSGDAVDAVLDLLPAPTYVTDAEGTVLHFNEPCIGFTGRLPVRGQDRWCVTWRLLTDQGDALPHDQCPMAEAIRQKKKLRGAFAIALRPDGSRVRFTPFPTPLLDQNGVLLGAVNILLDVTLEYQVLELRRRARNCRRLALQASGDDDAGTLNNLADDYESAANALERPN